MLQFNKVYEKGKLIWQYSKVRGVLYGQVIFTADSLADVDADDIRNRGNDFFAVAMKVAMESIMEV